MQPITINETENSISKPKPLIMHVDDDINMLELFYYNFRKVFEVISLEDWSEVTEKVDFGQIDAVITDYEMPDTNGLEVLEKIKSINSEIPVIFYTGQGNEEIAREAFIRGATDYFTKELFSFAHKEKLINVINKAVEMRTERKLREASEEKFKALAELSPVAIMIFSHQGGLYSNSVCQQITGYSEQELRQKQLMELIHEDSKQVFLEAINNPDSYSDPDTKEIEIAITTKSGELKWLMVRNKNIIFDNTPCRLTTAIDITKKRKYEQAITELVKNLSFKSGPDYFDKLTELLAHALEADYTLIGELDKEKDQTINSISFYACGKKADNITYNLKDTPCENVVGKKTCIYPANSFKLFPKDELIVNEQIEGYIGYPLFTTKGDPLGIVVALFKKPISNVSFTSSILELFASRTAMDMERTKAEEQMLQERYIMKQYFDFSDEIILIIGKDKTIRLINKTGLNLLGYKEEEVIGKNWIKTYIPERLQEEKEILFEKFINGETEESINSNGTFLSRDGREINVRWRHFPLKNEQGEIVGLINTGKLKSETD